MLLVPLICIKLFLEFSLTSKTINFFHCSHRHSLAYSGCFNRIEKSVHMPTSQLVCLLTRHLLSFVQYFLILDNFNHKKKSMKIQPILQESIQENRIIILAEIQGRYSDPGISFLLKTNLNFKTHYFFMNLCRVISCPPIVSQYMAPKVKMSTSDTMGDTTRSVEGQDRVMSLNRVPRSCP